MIVYQLRCGASHNFEAWFRNSDAYDQQHAAKQISCPVCGDENVGKAPMAPRIGRSDRGKSERVAEDASPPAVPPSPDQFRPEHIKMVLIRIAELNQHIANTCDYVGGAFPEEARKIHYGEAEHREIYGEATPSEAAELQEEGIAVAAVPWLRKSDS